VGRPELLEAELSEAVRNDALLGEQLHQLEELRLRERTPLADLHEPRDGLNELIVLGQLLRRHLDGDPCIGPRRQLREDFLSNAPDDARREARAQRSKVACPRLSLSPVAFPLRVPGYESPLRRERDVIDPVEDRRKLLEP